MTSIDHELICTKTFFPRKPSPQDTTSYTIVDSAGLKLYCHYFTRPTSLLGSLWNTLSGVSAKTLVFFHGNGEIVADYVDSKFKQGLEAAGFNIFFVEYRGYGQSDGKPAYTTIFEDLKHIHDHLVTQLRVSERDIICFGRSLGGLYATEFALQYPGIKALVLECTFSDPTDLIYRRVATDAALVEQFPRDKVAEECFKYINNAEKLRRINPNLPVLILHAADDNLIAKNHAEENYNACASTKKRLVMYPIGQHNFFHAANSEPYEMEGVKYDSIYNEVAKLL